MKYFAYGSNMLEARLRHRVPSAAFVEVATLADHTVAYRKPSKDGSSKCTVVAAPDRIAWGVVFDIADSHVDDLDAVEGYPTGYDRRDVTVSAGGVSIAAMTYVALKTVDQLPYDWYRDLVVAGAKEHGLPGDYIDAVLDIGATPDPDKERARCARRYLRSPDAG